MSPTATLQQDLPREVRRSETTRLLEEAAVAVGEERDALIDQVIVINTSVARAIAARYSNRGIAQEDLEQVAYLALVRAAHKFDGRLAEDFLVYAVPTIRGEVKRYFRDHGWTVRPPRRVQELQAEVMRSESTDPAELAQAIGVTEAEVIEAQQLKGCFSPLSLDAPVSTESDAASLGDLLAGEDPEHSASEARLMLGPALRSLTERERLIVRLRFVEDLTQEEIGEQIGVTQMQVSRLLKKVMAKLREQLGVDDTAPLRATA
ncbi:MAG: sigma-70 family RNA polymerase sigma factor [Nocardioides sp.]